MRGLAVAVAVLAAFPLTAAATVLSFDFTGAVTSFTGSGTALSDNFSVNDAVSGTFSYDDARPGTTTATRGFYAQPGQVFNVTVGGITFQAGSFNSNTTDIAGFDRFELVAFNPSDNGLVLPSGFRISSMVLDFQDTTGTALADVSLPASLDFSDWTSIQLKFQAATASNTVDSEMFATISSLTAAGDSSQLPEPATLVLLGLGLAGIGAVRRKNVAARAR